MSNLVLRKVSLGSSKVPYNGHLCSKLLSVKMVHLVRNTHEEGEWFLNVKLSGSLRENILRKYFDDWDPIFQRLLP